MKNVRKNNNQIKVLIADRSVFFRSGLRFLLSAQGDVAVVTEAAELTDAIAQACALDPDVLVVDSSLAASSCLALRELKCPVLWLAQDESDDQLCLAVAAGARAYMLKSSTPAELVAGIRHVALTAGKDFTGVSKVVPDMQALQAPAEKPSRAMPLTARERDVICLLAEGLTARKAALELGLSIKTVEAHTFNLMRKLDLHNRASLIAYAIDAGIATAEVPS